MSVICCNVNLETHLELDTMAQVGMGRDHTIYALAPGFVRFYKEKHMRGERKYVGVVLNRGEVLPRDETTLGRSRYFGFVDVGSTTRTE